jgi:hypothetical protein
VRSTSDQGTRSWLQANPHGHTHGHTMDERITAKRRHDAIAPRFATTSARLVMNAVPNNTVIPACGDGRADLEGQAGPERTLEQVRDLVALLRVRQVRGAVCALVRHTGVWVICHGVTHETWCCAKRRAERDASDGPGDAQCNGCLRRNTALTRALDAARKPVVHLQSP